MGYQISELAWAEGSVGPIQRFGLHNGQMEAADGYAVVSNPQVPVMIGTAVMHDGKPIAYTNVPVFITAIPTATDEGVRVGFATGMPDRYTQWTLDVPTFEKLVDYFQTQLAVAKSEASG